MSNTRHLNWYGSPLIRAIGTTLVFLSLMSVPVASHAQNLGKQPATGQAVQGEQASQPEGAFLNLVDWDRQRDLPGGSSPCHGFLHTISPLTRWRAGEWSFPDAPLRGVFGRNDVYAGITGWDSFEPWLSRIESFPESSLWGLANQIPREWYGSAVDELERLLARLLERRSRVRELILSFRDSSRNPFPNWSEAVTSSLGPRGQCGGSATVY
jgi:hypothetical protein